MLIVLILALCNVPIAFAGGLILNEYNAVDPVNWLNGGDEFADDDGGLAGDLTFGRVQGNGGDWFELVVTEDGLDLRGWEFVLSEDGFETETLVLSQDNIWTTLQAGTIITISEVQAEDVSYDPMAGDWHINVQAQNSASGTYISATSFSVSNDDWQIEIFDALDVSQFGPAGEGVGVLSGVNSREIVRLEEDPSIYITRNSICFDDAKTNSTWGLASQWSSGTKTQDFAPLRNGTAPTTQCDDLNLTELAYDPERLLEVDITIDPAEYEFLRRQNRRLLDTFGGACGLQPPVSPYIFFSAEVTIDGTTITGAGVRKKGFYGSPDRVKPSFKIDFEEFGGTQHVYGMERMTLNNGRQDPSLLDQCIGYSLFRAAGLAAPRCNFAHVRVNGVSKGIYMNVESIKDPFLLWNYGDDTGNLYEGTVADFREYWIGLIEKKNNDDDVKLLEVQAALSNTDDATFLVTLASLIDLDKFITYWALSGLIGDWDGYPGNANNWWLYDNPSTGLLEFIPWSMDDILGRDSPFSDPSATSTARTVFETAAISNRLWQIPTIRAWYDFEINNLIATVFDEAALISEIDRMETLISPVAGDLSAAIQDTKDWINGRAAQVASDFASGPPTWESTLGPKLCLEPAGHLYADFTSSFSDPMGVGLNPGSTLTSINFELEGSTTQSGLDTGFGIDAAVGPNKITLRPIGISSAASGLVFNMVIDTEDVVVGAPFFFEVADTIASFLLYLDLGTLAIFPIGMLTDPLVSISSLSLTPGGFVEGQLRTDLALWKPHPVPEPSSLAMQIFGVGLLGLLDRRRRALRSRSGPRTPYGE